MNVTDQFVDIGIKLHIREWPGKGQPFVLLHGLASNCRTWDAPAELLAAAGHRVITVDQRGHGLSDKPEDGYDFATITADLAQLLEQLALKHPILVGQSWGGNVLLEFGARYPSLACGLGFVDGGFLDLRTRPGATWEKVSQELKPPPLEGTPRSVLKDRIQAMHPEWSEAGVEATLANFETLPDGTVRPQLSLDKHLKILHAMWEQQTSTLFRQVTAPTLICVAESSQAPDWTAQKARQVAVAQANLVQTEVYWFAETDHDIHVHRPTALVQRFKEALSQGIWQTCTAAD